MLMVRMPWLNVKAAGTQRSSRRLSEGLNDKVAMVQFLFS
jgi:hypothetical protein